MRRNRNRVKHVVNWNIIALILAVVGAIVGTIFTYNQKEINIQKAELTRLTSENETLKSEIDPEWHSKFNNQRHFF